MLLDHPETVVITKTSRFLRFFGFKPWREVRVKRYAGVGGWFEDRTITYLYRADA